MMLRSVYDREDFLLLPLHRLRLGVALHEPILHRGPHVLDQLLVGIPRVPHGQYVRHGVNLIVERMPPLCWGYHKANAHALAIDESGRCPWCAA